MVGPYTRNRSRRHSEYNSRVTFARLALLGTALAVLSQVDGCHHQEGEKDAVASCAPGAAIVPCVIALQRAGVACDRAAEDQFAVFYCKPHGSDFTQLDVSASPARIDRIQTLHFTADGAGSESLLPDVDKAVSAAAGEAATIETPEEGSPIYSYAQSPGQPGGAIIRVSQGSAAELFLQFESDGTDAADSWVANVLRAYLKDGPY
jgi:hypothetical protein